MQLLTEKEAAERLRCTVAAMRRWRRERRGPRFARLGRLIRYSEADLSRFVDECTEATRKKPFTIT
ncbi:MAG: helix-turn-helix domain-containing protein [Acidobacteria bacterium]|nr:helix-turn-helix domain-containing protein [Acidobacteriota bacterium]